VRVPSTGEEALRDLVRAREDVRGDLMQARHRMGKLLLRHDVRYDGAGENWTHRHRDWLSRVELAERGAQVTLLDYLGAIDALVVRRDALEVTIAELVPGSPWAQTVARLRCLRGIDTLSAVRLCVEIGDFGRFARAGQLASYLGLVPSEDSSGQRRRLGSITKTGSRHARRLLIEAAWHYRRPPARGAKLIRRQAGQDPHVIALAWKAQQRLHRTWRRLDSERGKRRTIVAVAVARELAGFCWALTTTD
jgi:transposase